LCVLRLFSVQNHQKCNASQQYSGRDPELYVRQNCFQRSCATGFCRHGEPFFAELHNTALRYR
jgi:hypothetical protein